MNPEFRKFPKIPRLFRPCIVTEKIDGTNASVHILEDGTVLAASRKRYITPDDDNFGFAAWVKEHEGELREGLGVGSHYGEWWGRGIQRGYGLDHRRFSLFNVSRWRSDQMDKQHFEWESTLNLTDRYVVLKCCRVVPILYMGPFDMLNIYGSMVHLNEFGSHAAPGFMRPEGIVVYHTAGNCLFKVTLENDDQPKG